MARVASVPSDHFTSIVVGNVGRQGMHELFAEILDVFALQFPIIYSRVNPSGRLRRKKGNSDGKKENTEKVQTASSSAKAIHRAHSRDYFSNFGEKVPCLELPGQRQ